MTDMPCTQVHSDAEQEGAGRSPRCSREIGSPLCTLGSLNVNYELGIAGFVDVTVALLGRTSRTCLKEGGVYHGLVMVISQMESKKINICV